MLIPHYWAESRLRTKSSAKQVTVKRWGWSDISQEDAQAMADRRGQEAMNRILNGENLRRRESKDSYGTQEGVPIREEVISRHGKIAITRNSYGSLCLNTPNVFFADVDAQWRGALKGRPLGCLFIVLFGIIAGFWQHSILLGAGIASGIPWLWSQAYRWINRKRRSLAEARTKQESLAAIRAFATAHPHWHLRVYETPAGYRLLAMHDVFDPQGDVSQEALKALNSDKRFATLCALQSCFRARVSPKYWRTAYRPQVHLPKSKWPFPPEHLPRRQAWVAGYERAASRFASCRFVERLGSHVVHPDAEAVREVHDSLSQADSSLPLA